MELIHIVKRHCINAHLPSVTDERVRLTKVGKDDMTGIDATDAKNLRNFSVGGAVEASTRGGQQTQDIGIRIALDSWEEVSVSRRPLVTRVVLTIVRRNLRQTGQLTLGCLNT